MSVVQRHGTGLVFTMLDYICANTANDCCDLSAVAVYLSPRMWSKALENYQHIPDNCVPFISVSGVLLYEFVCFPTVSLFWSLPNIE